MMPSDILVFVLQDLPDNDVKTVSLCLVMFHRFHRIIVVTAKLLPHLAILEIGRWMEDEQNLRH